MVSAAMCRSGKIYQGQILHYMGKSNADGTPQRWKVTSVKLWKRDPNRFRLGLKFGLYSHETVDETTRPTILAQFKTT